MSIIWTIVIGFVVGLIARAILPGNQALGYIMTSVLGIAGSLIATFLGQALGWYLPGSSAGFLASVIGAIVLLLLYGMVVRKR